MGVKFRVLEAGIARCLQRVLAMALLLAVGACAAAAPILEPAEPLSFLGYQHQTLEHLRSRRGASSSDLDAELLWNSPREWRPSGVARGVRPEKGILLVHGLGDSPWTFTDIAHELADQGFLVRTVLLPGHGTRPHDMLDVDLEQWRQVVREQAAVLRRDVDEVYLGGFSTGANLVTEYAYADDGVVGLLLFSPGFKSTTRLDWMAPLIVRVRPWLIAPDEQRSLQNEVRYFMVPTNGFAQFYRSSQAVRRLVGRRPYDKPVFMVVAQHDSVLDAEYLLETFQTRFTHQQSRLIWYGARPARLADPVRVLVRSDQLPQHRISQFSHMGIMFNPRNPLYGEHGSLRICWNGQNAAAMAECEAGASVWYSDWGYHEHGKIHARLTFNPYFRWQASVMASVLEAAGSSPTARAN